MKPSFNFGFFVVFVAAFVASCSLSAFVDYDKISDIYSTDLAKEYELFFIRMDRHFGAPERSYENSHEFYEKTYSTIGVLRLREEARGSKKTVIDALNSLERRTWDLEDLHKKNQLTKDLLAEEHTKIRKELLVLIAEEYERLFEEMKKRKDKK